MEQATNLFTKGLQLDTHPMVLSNDTLSDCLNGTLITMNGNEVILLNDMGNRRVDKAFLPPGYEPVGIKEYGGIIYVASYNPITNKSLIGSFPSPLKKLSSIDEDLSGTFDFANFTSSYNVETDETLGLDVLKSDSFMLPLTKDINLRAGDKFAVYAEGLSLISNLLTNYNNTSGNKAYSPKNRKYTLQLGVLNSLNEFVDITKSLCRWKSTNGTWLPVNYESEVSEIFKFNDGYFISDAFTNTFNAETIADAKLIKERLKIAANTYAYKLVGPLYLKLSFNHIENFNYNIYGLYNGTSATLWIEGFLTYNCPDNSLNTNGINNEDENYATFDEGIPSSSFGFNLRGYIPVETQIGRSIYNPNTNTYSVKIVKKYTNIVGTRGTIFDYVLGVKAGVDNESIYLRGLSVAGSIDLALLGSGIVKLNGWRFYNNIYNKNIEDNINSEEDITTKINSSILTFAFNAYPEYGKSFVNLRFRFHNIEHNSSSRDIYYPKEGGMPLYNGRQTIQFGWNEIGLEERSTYQITTYYNIKDNDTGTIDSNHSVQENSSRWFTTASLFNDFYSATKGVADFCNVNRNEHPDFYEKMVVDFANKSKLINNSIKHEKLLGSLIQTFNSNVDYACENYYSVNITIDPELAINNEDKYPKYIYVRNKKAVEVKSIKPTSIGENDSLSNHSGNNDYSDILRPQLTEILGRDLELIQENNPSNRLLETPLLLNEVVIDSNNSKHITGELKYYDIFKAVGEPVTTITNGFDNFSELLTENSEVLPFSGYYAGVVTDFDSRPGSYLDLDGTHPYKDYHYVEVATKLSDISKALPPDHEVSDPYGYIDITDKISENPSYKNEGTVEFKISKYLGTIYLHFNNNIENTDIIFLYFFCTGNRFTKSAGANFSKTGAKYTRAWWRMPNGEWACFKDLFELKLFNGVENAEKSFISFLKSELGNKELVYCMYDSTNNNSVIYAPKENYTYYNTYNIPMVYEIEYKLSGNETPASIINTSPSIGNLQFSVTNNPKIDSDLVTFNLNSYGKFHDNIHSLDSENISNVYIRTGAMKDNVGRALNPSFIYVLNDDNELVRLENSDFYVDTINKSRRGKNLLLYNSTQKGNVNYPCLEASTAGENSHTVITYDSVNIIHPI